MSPVVAFAGYSGAGKTTLIEQVLALLTSWGLRVSVLKHAHHHFDVDRPGKDSWRHRQAGAREVMVASSQRWALMHEHGEDNEPNLEQLLSHLAPCDLVILEGFKREAVPKCEVWRAVPGVARLAPDDPCCIALITAVPPSVTAVPPPGTVPILSIDDPMAVAHFLAQHFGLERRDLEGIPVRAGAVSLRYFAQLRERVGRERELLPIVRGEPLSDLVLRLQARPEPWASAFAPGHGYRASVNRRLVPWDQALQDGDEVALFPPVTGG